MSPWTRAATCWPCTLRRPTHRSATRWVCWQPPVQEVTGENVPLARVDQSYTGPAAAQAAAEHGIQLEVVKLAEAKKSFVLLPRRWVVERPFGWIARCCRLARDYERLPETFAGLHWLMFSGLRLARLHFQSFVSS